MKTPILEKIYDFLLTREEENNDFIMRTADMDRDEDEITDLFPEESRQEGNTLLCSYGYRQFACGYINGFKAVIKLIKELESYQDNDFLLGILAGGGTTEK